MFVGNIVCWPWNNIFVENLTPTSNSEPNYNFSLTSEGSYWWITMVLSLNLIPKTSITWQNQEAQGKKPYSVNSRFSIVVSCMWGRIVSSENKHRFNTKHLEAVEYCKSGVYYPARIAQLNTVKKSVCLDTIAKISLPSLRIVLHWFHRTILKLVLMFFQKVELIRIWEGLL